MAQILSGTPIPADKLAAQCVYESVSGVICNDTGEDIVLDAAAIDAAINASADTYATGVAVDTTAADQDLLGFIGTGGACGTYKKADGQTFKATATVCVTSENGELIDLLQNGQYAFGDTNSDGDGSYLNDSPITIAETVTIPVGAVFSWCATLKLSL